jgi:hypothetical protein
MVRTLKSKFIIFLIFFFSFLAVALLGTSHTLFAVIQASQSNPHGAGAYGQGAYGYGYVPAEAPSGQGASGAGGKKYVPPDLLLSQNLIKVELKQGETKTVEMKINNTGSPPQSVSVDLQDLKEFILLSESSFALTPYEEKTLTLGFTASQTESPQVHMGKMIIRSDYTQKIVSIVIEVQQRKALFDIKVKVPEEFKTIEQGEEVEADIMMYNLGDLMPVDVSITYSIKDFDGNITNLGHETLAVEEQKRIRRQLLLPEELNPDSYLFYALLEYEDQKATSSDIFEVKEKVIEEQISLWDFLKAHKLTLTLSLIIFFILVVYATYRIISYQITKKVNQLIQSGTIKKRQQSEERKSIKKSVEKFDNLKLLTEELLNRISKKEYDKAKKLYNILIKEYKSVPVEEQPKIYTEIFPRIISELKKAAKTFKHKDKVLKEVKNMERLIQINKLTNELQEIIKERKYGKAKEKYERIKKEYEKIPLKDKVRIYRTIRKVVEPSKDQGND